MDSREFLVTGVVQGVGYRAFARRRAVLLGLAGWAENQADGSVLIRAAGDAPALRAFAQALNEGPPGGRVDRVVTRDVPLEGISSNRFDIR